MTIQKINVGLATGDILCQGLMEFDEEQETFRSTSYEKLNREINAISADNWNAIKTKQFKARSKKVTVLIMPSRDFIRIANCIQSIWMRIL